MQLKSVRWPANLIAKIEAYRKDNDFRYWGTALRHIVTMFFKGEKR